MWVLFGLNNLSTYKIRAKYGDRTTEGMEPIVTVSFSVFSASYLGFLIGNLFPYSQMKNAPWPVLFEIVIYNRIFFLGMRDLELLPFCRGVTNFESHSGAHWEGSFSLKFMSSASNSIPK
jgi:hypothetical protein